MLLQSTAALALSIKTEKFAYDVDYGDFVSFVTRIQTTIPLSTNPTSTSGEVHWTAKDPNSGKSQSLTSWGWEKEEFREQAQGGKWVIRRGGPKSEFGPRTHDHGTFGAGEGGWVLDINRYDFNPGPFPLFPVLKEDECGIFIIEVKVEITDSSGRTETTTEEFLAFWDGSKWLTLWNGNRVCGGIR